MKKIISCVLVFTVVISLTLTGFAQTNTNETPIITKEQALKIAIKFIKTGWNYNIKRDEKVTIIYKKNYLNCEKDSWEINWAIKNDLDNIYIDINVNSLTGNVEEVVFDKMPIYSSNSQEKCEIINLAEAKNIADKFFKKLNNSFYKQTKYNNYCLNQNKHILNYKFTYLRQHNGKAVKSNNVTININANTKEVTNYICYWDNNAMFKPIKNNISMFDIDAFIPSPPAALSLADPVNIA